MVARTLILAAHGAGEGSPANTLVEELARRVGAALPGVRVLAAFNLGSPTFEEVLDDAEGPVRVVPVMTGRGWFVDLRLPAMLRHSLRFEELDVSISAPVGCVRALVAGVTEVAAVEVERVSRETGVMPAVNVVAHGTRRSAASQRSGMRLSRLIGNRTGAVSMASFLEAEPTIEHVTAGIEGPLVVVPWLLGGGVHAQDDVPRRLGREAVILPALGEMSGMLEAAVLHLAGGGDCGWGGACCAARGES